MDTHMQIGAVPRVFMEHRWGRRRACAARVEISVGGTFAAVGRLRNVSTSGAYLETGLPLSSFAQVSVRVLREDDSCYEAAFAATVVRTEADGVGLEWNETAPGPICCLLGCAATCAAFARDGRT